MWKGNVGVEPSHRVLTAALPSVARAVRKGPPSSRPQNGRSTDNLRCVYGKAADTHCQPVMAAGREAVSCKTTMGAYLLHQCDLDMRHGVKGDYFGALRVNECPAGF